MRGPIRIAVACALVAAPACFADLGGFSGGSRRPAPHEPRSEDDVGDDGDGGVGPGDAAPGDATPPDAGADGPSTPDTGADAAPFCPNAPPHTACAGDDRDAATTPRSTRRTGPCHSASTAIARRALEHHDRLRPGEAPPRRGGLARFITPPRRARPGSTTYS